MFAPIDAAAVVILLDIDTTLPMTIIGSFRPALRAMWPAGAATRERRAGTPRRTVYELSEDSGHVRRDCRRARRQSIASVMPYQEEPRDVPLEFAVEVTPEQAARELIPDRDHGGHHWARAAARAASQPRPRNDPCAVRADRETLYANLLARTLRVTTPDARLTRAFDWARIGMDKGMATNPTLGTVSLLVSARPGNSERPGFAWFFGRDALWTVARTHRCRQRPGRARRTRVSRQVPARRRKDPARDLTERRASSRGSPTIAYAWASADATPLYVIAHADTCGPAAIARSSRAIGPRFSRPTSFPWRPMPMATA